MMSRLLRSDRTLDRSVRELSEELEHSFCGGFDDEGGTGLGEPPYEAPLEDYYFETWEEFEAYYEEMIFGLIPEEALDDSALETSGFIDSAPIEPDLTLEEFFDLFLGEE